jgi:hypothetical protein
MRAMVVEVAPEIEQIVFEIYRRPEQQVIQLLASFPCPTTLASRFGPEWRGRT